MFQFFKNLFSQPDPFNFMEVQPSDLDQWPDGIRNIHDRKLDGFLIRGALSPEEVQTLLDGLHSLPEEEIIKVNEGISMFPETFAQYAGKTKDSDDTNEAYFKASEAYQKSFAERLGFDFEAKVHEILGKLSGGRPMRPTPGLSGSGSFIPFNFRMLPAGPGELKSHCFNFFLNEFPQFFGKLAKKAKVENQLSFFVTLQPAESGGELTLFDAYWKDVEIRLPGGKQLQGKDGKIYDLTNPKKCYQKVLIPQAGDMILFCGSQIWHQVNIVKGTRPRITLGSFLSLSHDDSEIYYWT